MNKLDKKGFSLVELIGVIALLGLIIVIATTSGLGAFNNAKDRLKEEDEKTIVEAAKVLMTEILYCDDTVNTDLLKTDNSNDFACIKGYSEGETVTWSDLLDKAKNDEIKITLDYLIDNKLVTGTEIEKMKGEGITYTGTINSDNIISVAKN